MYEELDAKVEQCQKEYDALLESLNPVRSRLIDKVAARLERWYWDEAERFVKKHSNITLELSKQQLSVLKERVRELQSQAREIAEKHIRELAAWERPVDHQYVNYSARQLDAVMGRMGKMLILPLEAYGYCDTNGDGEAGDRIGNPMTKDLENIWNEVHPIRREIWNAHCMLDMAKKSRAATEAQDNAKQRWDEA
ncbi:hypothetical protein [Aeoliella sp.]|uniref:hypothetical protein n=1 Tax=Aeoliella sp. TaxID=2795800 RepID=UPI003CCB7F7D